MPQTPVTSVRLGGAWVNSDSQQMLVWRIRRGEHAALGELYDLCAGRVYRVAWRLTGCRCGAEEITAAVFVQAWRCPDRLVGHHDQLPEHLLDCAYTRAVAWCDAHGTRRPTLAACPPHAGWVHGATIAEGAGQAVMRPRGWAAVLGSRLRVAGRSRTRRDPNAVS